MKHRVYLLIVSILLSALILLLLPAPKQQAPVLNVPSPTTPPATQPTTPPTEPEEPSVVRFYCCDPAWAEVYGQLAAEYTAQTGTAVVIQTADGKPCQTALEEYMQGPNPPTVLCMHGREDFARWQDVLLDLQDTEVASKLCSSDFGMWSNGQMLAVAVDVEGFGLLLNAQVLSKTHTRGDINSLSSLKTAVKILKDSTVKVFGLVSFADGEVLRLLESGAAGDIREFLDIYRNHCDWENDAVQQFLKGNSVFYLGDTDDYALFADQPDSTLQIRDLDILPTFTAGAMQYICKTAWGVNGNVRPEDLEVTLDFLGWLVTAGENTAAPVDRLQVVTPFADAAWHSNHLENKLLTYMRTEAAVVQWECNNINNSQLLNALKKYIAEGTEENWAALAALLPKK